MMPKIFGFSELLSTDRLNKDDAKEYVNIINQSSHQLLYVVDELLDISMIETGNMRLVEHTIDLNKLIDEVHATFIPLIKPELTLSITKALPDNDCNIKTDGSKLRQILNNLLTNSNKYTDTGSIQLEYTIDGPNLLFKVKDTGIGISNEVHKQVFERFIKAHNEKVRHYDGVGLGLAICKGNVELMGGQIGFESEPNKGSTFYFTIPYQPVSS